MYQLHQDEELISARYLNNLFCFFEAMTYMTLRHQQRKEPAEDGSKPCNDFEHKQPFHIYQKRTTGKSVFKLTMPTFVETKNPKTETQSNFEPITLTRMPIRTQESG